MQQGSIITFVLVVIMSALTINGQSSSYDESLEDKVRNDPLYYAKLIYENPVLLYFYKLESIKSIYSSAIDSSDKAALNGQYIKFNPCKNLRALITDDSLPPGFESVHTELYDLLKEYMFYSKSTKLMIDKFTDGFYARYRIMNSGVKPETWDANKNKAQLMGLMYNILHKLLPVYPQPVHNLPDEYNELIYKMPQLVNIEELVWAYEGGVLKRRFERRWDLFVYL